MGGLDGYYVALLKDWDIEEAVPGPLGPMQLLVAGSPEEVPLILGCFLGAAHLTVWPSATRPACSHPESFHPALD